MSKRVLLVAAVAALIAGAGAFALRGGNDDATTPAAADRDRPSLDEMADDVGAPILEHLQRGYAPGRSGQIQLVPKPHNFILGEVDLTLLGTTTPIRNTTHPNPWSYLTRVPIGLYGPGYVKPGRTIYSEADIAGLAPTYAGLLGMTGGDFEGEVLSEAVTFGKPPPKLIFTVVIDGGGWNALQLHPNAWPNIKSLFDDGSVYVNATIGSAPAITGAIHATFGTGVYPRTHGIGGNQVLTEDGGVEDIYLEVADPGNLDAPTLAELWDESQGNRPVVATVAFEDWHLGMIGHGAQREGGDKDVAAFWNREDPSWYTNEEFYELPDYLRNADLSRLARYEEALDARDGLNDGLWFGRDLEELRDLAVQPATPAFTRFTGDAVIDVLKNEKMGLDDVPDVMWVNLKPPDFAGHVWNVITQEEDDVLRETDAQIGRFRDYLDEAVGRGNYVFAISADHGQELLPDVTGGWRISATELHGDLTAEFGDIFLKVATGEIFIDEDKAADEGVDLDEIAEFIGAYTIGDNVPDAFPGAERVPEGRLDEALFAGAFTGEFIEGLSPDDVDELGDSIYDEGSLTIGRDGAADG